MADNGTSKIIDTTSASGILTAKEVVQYLPKSLSWVYKNWQLLGGVKLGGSLFFPSKGEFYERLFQKGQGLANGLHTKRGPTHPRLVHIQNKGQTGRSPKKKGANTEWESDPNRHGLLATGEQKT